MARWRVVRSWVARSWTGRGSAGRPRRANRGRQHAVRRPRGRATASRPCPRRTPLRAAGGEEGVTPRCFARSPGGAVPDPGSGRAGAGPSAFRPAAPYLPALTVAGAGEVHPVEHWTAAGPGSRPVRRLFRVGPTQSGFGRGHAKTALGHHRAGRGAPHRKPGLFPQCASVPTDYPAPRQSTHALSARCRPTAVCGDRGRAGAGATRTAMEAHVKWSRRTVLLGAGRAAAPASPARSGGRSRTTRRRSSVPPAASPPRRRPRTHDHVIPRLRPQTDSPTALRHAVRVSRTADTMSVLGIFTGAGDEPPSARRPERSAAEPASRSRRTDASAPHPPREDVTPALDPPRRKGEPS